MPAHTGGTKRLTAAIGRLTRLAKAGRGTDPERERREPPLRVDCHCAGGVLDDYWQRDRVAFTASYSIAEALQAKKTVRLTSVPLCIADRVCDRRDTSLVQSGQP